jgi:hypothetical protein
MIGSGRDNRNVSLPAYNYSSVQFRIGQDVPKGLYCINKLNARLLVRKVV